MSIRWRLTLFNALVIGVILVGLGLALFFLLRGTLISSVEKTTESRAYTAARSISEGEGLEEEDGRLVLDDDLVEGLTLDGVFIIVRDSDGNIITQTVNLPTNREAENDIWRLALSEDAPAYGTAPLSGGESLDYIYAVPVNSSGPARVVEAGKSYGPAEENLQRVSLVLIGGISIALLLSVVGAYLLARAALSPVAAVVAAARSITDGGDFSGRLPSPGSGARDEISGLTATMNVMLARLEDAYTGLEDALERQRRFAADASHELRTPLTSIDGYAGILEEWGLNDPDVGPESVAAIRRETARMRELVESLLMLTRGDEGAPLNLERGDLADVISESIEDARASSAGKVSIVFDPPKDDSLDATFDRDRLRQVMTILLDNAVKYTPPGGSVKVEAKRSSGSVEVAVSDTGVGISADALPHLFERFYRVDAARSGTMESVGGAGLGLAIADQIMSSHGGEITASSVPGEGSSFTLVFPDDANADADDAERRRSASPARKLS